MSFRPVWPFQVPLPVHMCPSEGHVCVCCCACGTHLCVQSLSHVNASALQPNPLLWALLTSPDLGRPCLYLPPFCLAQPHTHQAEVAESRPLVGMGDVFPDLCVLEPSWRTQAIPSTEAQEPVITKWVSAHRRPLCSSM